MRVAELVAGRQARDRQLGASQPQPGAIGPVPAAVVRQLEDVHPFAKPGLVTDPPPALRAFGIARKESREAPILETDSHAVVVLVLRVLGSLREDGQGD